MCAIIALGLAFVRHIHGAPMVVALLVLAITAGASGYAGWLFSRLDGPLVGLELESVRRSAHHVDSAVYTCQVLAAIGAILGVYMTASSGGTTASMAVTGVLDAMANGLLATLTGIVCSLLLFWEHHAIQHVLGE